MNIQKKFIINDFLPKEWIDKIDSDVTKNTENMFNDVIEKNISECKEIFPYDSNDIFSIFNKCKLEDIKVVIIGQDPYHNNKYQANGIAFSVNKDVVYPPSLKNIFKELERSMNIKCKSGDLTPWVTQGVFLLNTTLTVTQSEPGKHKNVWYDFTDDVIKKIQAKGNVIFCLWGKFAEQKEHLLTNESNRILKCSHPSPLSAYKTDNPFIGSDMFVKINKELKILDKDEIDWNLN